mmetsp:Transcript_102439/g.159827  ORF Transcript_102439/g.159827 Transcript_102439/m.159827 type:complete len:601 (+) Transcript_102439:12-1814(+)
MLGSSYVWLNVKRVASQLQTFLRFQMLVAVPVPVPGFSAPGTRECARDRFRFSHGGKICTHNAALLSFSERPSATRCSMTSTSTAPATLCAKQRRSIRQLCQPRPSGVLTVGPRKVMSCSKNSSLSGPVGQFGQQVFCTLREVEQSRSDPWEFVPIVQQKHLNLQHSRRPCRILCYGDSNTAGYTNQGRTYVPFAESLSDMLRAGGAACDVGVCGLNGFTAKQLRAGLGERHLADTHGRGGKGLARILDEDGPIDLVIIMIGTNDLARGMHPMTIVNDVLQLHDACHERGVPTLALAPPFGVTLQRNHKSVKLRKMLVELLQSHLDAKEGLLAYFDVEEIVPQSCREYWGDAIHFSAAGNQFLGRRLGEWLLPVLQTARLEDGVQLIPNEDAEVVPVSVEVSRYPPYTPRAARARSISPTAVRPVVSPVASVSPTRLRGNNRSVTPDIEKQRSLSLPPPDGQYQYPLDFSSTYRPLITSETIRQLDPSDKNVDQTVFVPRSLSREPRNRGESLADDVQRRRLRAHDQSSPRQRLSQDGNSDRSLYKEGDAVEVWSNTQQVWCTGRVKKVEGTRATCEFLLPDNGPAKKILSMKSRELRHA